jgi:hypothetical protein
VFDKSDEGITVSFKVLEIPVNGAEITAANPKLILFINPLL